MARAQAAAQTAAPSLELTTGKRNAVLGAILLAMFLGALDQNVVGTALPRIVTDLQGNGLYTWVVTAYLLTSTITVPIYGKLSDIYGRKRLLLIGVVVFLAGSLLSGISQDMIQLIFFRALQGLGAGALFPISLAIIGDLFSPRERGRYQGLFGAVFGLSFILGPFIGGWITDNINWHWVFYVNMPIGIATLVVISLALPNFHPDSRVGVRDLDYLGIGLFTGGVIPLLLGLTNKGLTDSHGKLYDWTNPSVGGLILFGLVMLALFVFSETRARQPIIPLELFKDRTFSATNLAVFMVMFGMFAAVIFLPRYYQSVRGISATRSGYMIWPLLAGLIGSSIVSGILISKIGRYKTLLVGAMVMFVASAILMTRIRADTPDLALWGWMLLMGLGIGPAMSGFTVVVQNSAPREKLGVATSTLTFLRQIGGSVGLAISGTLFGQSFTQLLPGRLLAHGVPRHITIGFATGGSSSRSSGSLTGVNLAATLSRSLPAHLSPASRSYWQHVLIPRIVAGVHDAFSLAIGNVFWLTVGGGVVAFCATLAVADLPLRDRAAASAETADLVPISEAPVGEAASEKLKQQAAQG
jgi:EmrB/QacA subfamily drug resistance transporter